MKKIIFTVIAMLVIGCSNKPVSVHAVDEFLMLKDWTSVRDKPGKDSREVCVVPAGNYKKVDVYGDYVIVELPAVDVYDDETPKGGILHQFPERVPHLTGVVWIKLLDYKNTSKVYRLTTVTNSVGASFKGLDGGRSFGIPKSTIVRVMKPFEVTWYKIPQGWVWKDNVRKHCPYCPTN